ncbi:MAG: 5-formyltetrahydrofolate cyclo-ligase [Chitinivibrionia bacterium]|nr:5-formyltetrahydrofolate cyclo-ligase [Chitinivibrionia bacterium]
MKTKTTLRNYYRELRKSISGKETLSEIICSHVKSLEIYRKSTVPALYWASKNEAALLKICEERGKNGVKFCLPRCLGENGEMEFFEANLNEMSLDCHNIPSPLAEKRILPQDLDCIFVPALAFDLLGNRLGQGGGYYDRYLKGCVNATKIGVCFGAQISQIPLETSEHDVKMDFIISEKGVIKC